MACRGRLPQLPDGKGMGRKGR